MKKVKIDQTDNEEINQQTEDDDDGGGEEEEANNTPDEFTEDDDPDENDQQTKKKKFPKKKLFHQKKRRNIDEEVTEDPSNFLIPLPGGPLEALAKQKRQPAQERAYKELSAINERIASLVQVRQMGLATDDNKKQLKQLMRDRKKKAYELKRLQSKQKASNKYRVRRKKIVRYYFFIFIDIFFSFN